MNIKNCFIFIYVCVFLSGCNEETKSTDWFIKNPHEMKKTYEECKKTGEDSNNCKNAKEAHFQIKQQNAPTLKFHD